MCYSAGVEKSLGLRTKLYIMILPLVLVVVMLSGVFSVLASRSALTPIATRLMAYKAEQLRDFVHSEWETVVALGLNDEPQFRLAAEESFRSYATGVLRSPSELIVVVDTTGQVVLELGGHSDQRRGPNNVQGLVEASAGWFSNELVGENRVGVVFEFDPFGWKVAVTELRSVFFTDAQKILQTHVLISIIALVSMTLLVWLYVGYLIRPLERLTSTVLQITATQDMSSRVTVEFPDEIGLLAHEFNTMISTLQTNYEQLSRSMQSETLARQTAVQREEETLLLLGRASEFHDQETGDHLERIGALSELFSLLLGDSETTRDLIRRGSALHDIGKIAIPDSVLLKPGRLTEEEFDHMKQHTLIGYELLKDSRSAFLLKGAEIALNHHEKWDGTGYPAGLKGSEIPISGRIVAVVDVFDALTSTRPYKEAWPPAKARALIASERSKHFDPKLVDIFLSHYDSFLALIQR